MEGIGIKEAGAPFCDCAIGAPSGPSASKIVFAPAIDTARVQLNISLAKSVTAFSSSLFNQGFDGSD